MIIGLALVILLAAVMTILVPYDPDGSPKQ